ncbi:hypothetical protein [Robertkochia solimangrovi]|uniref:hypothetical protein n=1 Tax=Robertkochia solimangrovi TaxID=2213046 RepID=UPI0011811184|nr:hypothetical protein [Robertkochia solimangrovi]TRZ41649.1 hypothetical protein DMZ48_16710 [Robertkochia solimangrovi]
MGTLKKKSVAEYGKERNDYIKKKGSLKSLNFRKVFVLKCNVMKLFNGFLIRFLCLSILIGCTNPNESLKPIIERDLNEYISKFGNNKLYKESTLLLTFYEYNDVNYFAITTTQAYKSEEIQGMFYYENSPILVGFEEGNLDEEKLNLVLNNSNLPKYFENYRKFIRINEEVSSDSYDSPYFRYRIIDNELIREK